ncbi:unnamed protein product [Lampetra planeri]
MRNGLGVWVARLGARPPRWPPGGAGGGVGGGTRRCGGGGAPVVPFCKNDNKAKQHGREFVRVAPFDPGGVRFRVRPPSVPARSRGNLVAGKTDDEDEHLSKP